MKMLTPLAGKLIKARGYSYKTTAQAQRNGSTDSAQLSLATEEARSILTHNRIDFEKWATGYFVTGKTHWGIIIAVRRPPPLLARHLWAILGRSSREAMKNQLVYI